MAVKVVIVGSGPSGFYTADALCRADFECQVDIIERLPAPHGLIRYGVAPDHQKTKNVSRNFDRTATNERMYYFGNVEVGSDVSLDELKSMYDAVVFASGSPFDRLMGIPGEEKEGVIGSAAFVGWYNGHPDFRDLNPNLNVKNVVVIGNGNVAIDCARVLVKTRKEMGTSDIPEFALDQIQNSSITDVHMVGRRGPIEAKFTNVELREMGELETCVPIIDASILPDKLPEIVEGSDRDRRVRERNLATLKEFAKRRPDELEKKIYFQFFAGPVEIIGGQKAEGVRFEKTKLENGRAVGTGEFFDIEAGLVIPAIGYRAEPIPGVPFDESAGLIPNSDGRVSEGVYAVGWVKRGPSGTIGTNKPDGQKVAKYIMEDLASSSKTGREALAALLSDRAVRRVNYEEWLRLDNHEKGNAVGESPRRKLVTVVEMMNFLDS